MPLLGNLRQTPLLDILTTIATEQRDGCLTLTYAHWRAEVYFRRGQWLAAERVPVGPPLTEQFVAMGFMTPEQIEEVILVPFDEAAVLPDGQIVQALMADGLLAREQLLYWAQHDATSLLNVILGWPDGEFSFVDGVHPPQELALVPMSVESILGALAQGRQTPVGPHSGHSPIPLQLLPETVLAFSDIADTGQIVEVTREEWMVLAQIDGANPLRAIAANLQMDARRLVDIAHNLLQRGLLEEGAAPSF
jgi:Domain of unknown function (DUF4388)